MGVACVTPARLPDEKTPVLATTPIVRTVFGTAVESHEKEFVLKIRDVVVRKRRIPDGRSVFTLEHGKARATFEAVAPVVEALLSELRANHLTSVHETLFATNESGFNIAHFSLWKMPHLTDEIARGVLRDVLLAGVVCGDEF